MCLFSIQNFFFKEETLKHVILLKFEQYCMKVSYYECKIWCTFVSTERSIKQGETEYYKITMKSLNMESANKVREKDRRKVTVTN